MIKALLKIFAVYFSSIVFALLLANFAGNLHETFFYTSCGGGLFLLEYIFSGCKFEGFIYSYIFFLSLLSFSLFKFKSALLNYIIGSFLWWWLIIAVIKGTYSARDMIVNVGILKIIIALTIIGCASPYLVRWAIKKLKH